MKLLRLKLENFRQHRDTDIEFQDGMTAIVGANGTGKTTILEAITFALYGVQRKTKESVRFYWAEPRSKVRVRLEFEFESKQYVLERTNSDASLVDVSVDPQVLRATGLREVKAASERLLRLTYDQFKNSFCAEQKHLTFLHFNTDTRRQEQVAKMLGFDRLKVAADIARDESRKFRFLADELERNLGNIEHLRQDLAASQVELSGNRKALETAIKDRDVLAAKSPAAEERKKLADTFFLLTQEANVFGGQAEALKAARKRAEDALAVVTAEVERQTKLRPDHEEFVVVDAAVRKMQELREHQIEREKSLAELERLKAEVAALDNRLGAMKLAELNALRKESEACSAAVVTADKALRAAEAARSRALQSAHAAHSAGQVEVRQAETALAKAKKLAEEGICPECGQPTTASFAEKLKCLSAELKTFEAAFAEAKKQLEACEKKSKAEFDAEDQLTAAQKSLRDAQAAVTEAERAHAEAKAITDERDSKQRRILEREKELTGTPHPYDRAKHLKAEARRNELRASHDAYLKLGDVEAKLKRAQTELATAQKELDEAKASYQHYIDERKKLPFVNVEEANAALVDFETLRREYAQAELTLKQAEGYVKLCETQVAQLEERIRIHQQAEAKLLEGRKQAILHETVEKEMKLLREELNSVIRPDLESRASENLALLTNGRYPILELDDEFNPTIIEDGIPKHVISGGEEDVVALALRLALSELIQERQGRPMSLMILDEVFGGLDADRRQAVLERLHSIKGRFEQILVISHIEEINQVADQCIFLTRDEQTRSTIVGDPPLDLNDLVLRA